MSTGGINERPVGHELHAVETAVWFVATQPGGPARLRALHKPGPGGHACAHCGDPWPCSIVVIAERAARGGD